MFLAIFRHPLTTVRLVFLAGIAALALAVATSAPAQQPAEPPQPAPTQTPATPAAEPDQSQTPANTADQPAAASPAPTPPAATPAPPPQPPDEPKAAETKQESKPQEKSESGGISEEELKQLLVGKALYLRGGYLDNTLRFDEHGHLIAKSPEGSYTLSAIQINKVRLTKHKVEFEGIRYGLHFVGQLPYEDSSTAFDRVRITPKKKTVTITVDREIVVKPKKVKEAKPHKDKSKKDAPAAATAKPEQPAAAAPAPSAPQPAPEPAELSEADQLKASIAAAPEAERPADPGSVTTTTSPAHATKLLKEALANIFAQGLDDRMMAALPDFWRLYYAAVAAKSDYRPKDPAVQRQNAVDKKAVLLTKFEPDSNEFAQSNGVAGMALYHTVVDADGKAQEIAVGRPIGFGLDENAVEAIRKASFQPAIKDGKPVPVLLDLVVQFRIFSKRTNVHSEAEASDKPAEPVLPGPYSLQRF